MDECVQAVAPRECWGAGDPMTELGFQIVCAALLAADRLRTQAKDGVRPELGTYPGFAGEPAESPACH